MVLVLVTIFTEEEWVSVVFVFLTFFALFDITSRRSFKYIYALHQPWRFLVWVEFATFINHLKLAYFLLKPSLLVIIVKILKSIRYGAMYVHFLVHMDIGLHSTICSSGYWVRQRKQSPRAPFLKMLCVVIAYFVAF